MIWVGLSRQMFLFKETFREKLLPGELPENVVQAGPEIA
jgi:hypothetical protein